MASFMDYYKDELRKQGTQPTEARPSQSQPKAPVKTIAQLNAENGKGSSEEAPVIGAAKWLLDIISRPLYGVQNAIQSTGETGERAGRKIASGDVAGGIGDAIANSPLNPVGGAFTDALRKGMFSNEADAKQSTSGTIEAFTDRAGKAQDPNYQDTEDNVNPWVKGIGGFIGDVALDPLTYIPGGVILSGAKKVAGGVDKALSGASKSLAGAPAARVAEEAVKTPKPKKAKTFKDDPEAELDAEDLFGAGYVPEAAATAARTERLEMPGTEVARQSDIATPTEFTPPIPAGVIPSTAIEAAPAAAQSADNPIASFLAQLEAPKAQAAPDVPAPTAAAAQLPDDVVDASGAIPVAGSTVPDLINASPNRSPIEEFLGGLQADVRRGGAERVSYPQWGARLAPDHIIKDPSGAARPMSYQQLRNLRRAYEDPSTPAGARPKKEVLQRYYGFLRQEWARNHGAEANAIDAMTAFQARAQADTNAVRNALGDDLFDYLGKKHSPAKFDRMVKDLRRVVEAPDDVAETLRTMDGNLSRLLSERLGLPKASKPKTAEEAADLAERLTANNDVYQTALSKGLARALDAEVGNLAEKGYLYSIRKFGMKVARTQKEAGEGQGRFVDQLNGFSQYTMLRSQKDAIEIAANDVLRARGMRAPDFSTLKSEQRSMVYKEAVLRVLDDQARLLDDIGAHMSIGTGADTVQLSMSEVFRAVVGAAAERGTPRTIDQALFNVGTQVAPTALTDAAAAAVKGADRDTILAILTSEKKYGNKGLLPDAQGKLPNNMVDRSRGWGYLNRSAAADLLRELGLPNDVVKNMVRELKSGATSKTTGNARKASHWYVTYRSGGVNHMAEALADTIMDAAPALQRRAAENEAAFVMRTRQEIHALSTDELHKIEGFLSDPTGFAAKARAMAARKRRMDAEAAAMSASVDAVNAAEGLVEAAVGTELVRVMDAAATAAGKASTAVSRAELQTAVEGFTGAAWRSTSQEVLERPVYGGVSRPGEELAEEVVEEARPLDGDWRDMIHDGADYIDDAVPKTKKSKGKGGKGKTFDVAQDAPVMIDEFGDAIIDPYGRMKQRVRNWFDQNHRAQRLMPVTHAWMNKAGMRTSFVNHQLSALGRAATKLVGAENRTDAIAGAFSAVQRGTRPNDPAQAEIYDMVEDLVKDFFDLDASGSMGNVFLRTTSKPQLINDMLKAKGIEQQFDLDAAYRAVKDGGSFDEALASQWKGWKVNDPLDFLHRLNFARQDLVFNAGAAKSMMTTFPESFWTKGSSTKRPRNFVRVYGSRETKFLGHLPEGTWMEPGLARELQRVEQVFRTSRQFDGALGDFVKNTYAPLLNAWKFAITLPRPGHHIRNLIGDTSVTWMARGNRYFSSSWKDAVKVLGARGNYADVNMLEAAKRYGFTEVPKGGDTIFKTERFGDFTADELYGQLAERGALPTYSIGEDFLDAGDNALNNVLGKITLRDTRVGEKLGGLSEGRDHLSRFQHFIQILRQDAKTFKGSRDELFDHAVKEVIKYHPDASLLTTTESKLRLAIPFYSWFGKILPAIVESTLAHPGRLSAFNKGSYAFATANGLDPESLSDPFPDDQLFPSFITDQALGPQIQMPTGEYIRVNPGIAHLDVLNTFGSDPIRGLAGMTSPLVRVPLELLGGSSWSTGGPINDWSDYVDSSLPGVNHIANVTGISPTGSVESVLAGEGLDPQAQVAKGNKTAFDQQLSVANWLTGLGLQNTSRQNYINYAEIERRNEGSK